MKLFVELRHGFEAALIASLNDEEKIKKVEDPASAIRKVGTKNRCRRDFQRCLDAN